MHNISSSYQEYICMLNPNSKVKDLHKLLEKGLNSAKERKNVESNSEQTVPRALADHELLTS